MYPTDDRFPTAQGRDATGDGDIGSDRGGATLSGSAGPLGDIARLRDVVSGRLSSWDRSGRNDDYWVIPPGGTITIADLPGPGTITHLWLTQWSRHVLGVDWEVPEPNLLRTLVLRITWDDQSTPAILVPLGDFFGLGNGIAATYASLPFTASANPNTELRQSGHLALNCYLPMPFGSRARIDLVNESDNWVGQYFQVDFELQRDPHSPEVGYLHATWRRDRSAVGWGSDLTVNGPEAQTAVNLDPSGNYTILQVEGDGQYVGCNLTVVHGRGDRRGLRPGESSWWGEGDDMIVVDGEPWPPRLHGTGSEDYFGHAWEMQRVAFPMTGSVIHEHDVPGVQVSYRFHLTDPVRFRKRIHVSMERGHANHLADDWSSTAYWYQRLPSPPASIAPAAERLPIHTNQAAGVRAPQKKALDNLPADRVEVRLAAAARLIDMAKERDQRLNNQAYASMVAQQTARDEIIDLRRRTLN